MMLFHDVLRDPEPKAVAFEIICRRYFVVICCKHLILPALPHPEKLGLAPMGKICKLLKASDLRQNRQSQSNPAEGWDGAFSASNIAAKATPNSSQKQQVGCGYYPS
jgi:hypothetical protein